MVVNDQREQQKPDVEIIHTNESLLKGLERCITTQIAD